MSFLTQTFHIHMMNESEITNVNKKQSMKTPAYIANILLLLLLCFPVLGQPIDPFTIHILAWSPTGDRLAVGTVYESCEFNGPDQYNVRIIDAQSNQVIQSLLGFSCNITGLAWSIDGHKLAASSLDVLGVRVWDVDSGNLISELQTATMGNTTVTWTTNDNYLAVANISNEIKLLNPLTGLTEAFSPVGGTLLAWQPSTNNVAIAGENEPSISIATLPGQNPVTILETFDRVTDLGWNFNGSKLAASTTENDILIWDSNYQLEYIIPTHLNAITSIDWRPNSNVLASASKDGYIKIWDTNTGLLIEQFSNLGSISDIDWHPTGVNIAYAQGNTTVNVVEPSPLPSPTPSPTLTSQARVIAWSPDGTRIAIGGGPQECDPEAPEKFGVHIYDSVSLQHIKTLSGFLCPVTSIDWSPDDYQIAATSLDGDGLRVWDVQSGQLISSLQRGSQGVNSVDWSAEGDSLAVAFISDAISIIDPLNGYATNIAPISGLKAQWNPDGHKLLSGGEYSTSVFVADMITNTQSFELLGNQAAITDVAWSPDGTLIASGGRDDSVRVWSSNTGQPIWTFYHSEDVVSVAWHPAGGRLASVGYDLIIKIWDVNSGLLVEQFPVDRWVNDLTWKPDGTTLAYADGGETIEFIQPSPLPLPSPTLTPSPSPTPATCDFLVQDGDEVYLIQAINGANATPETPDTICLSTNATYSFDAPHSGGYALPAITSEIAIIGNGSTLTRDEESEAEFGILRVGNTGTLFIADLTISNGYNNEIDGVAHEPSGGAIFNAGYSTINNLTFENNWALKYGGAVYNAGMMGAVATR